MARKSRAEELGRLADKTDLIATIAKVDLTKEGEIIRLAQVALAGYLGGVLTSSEVEAVAATCGVALRACRQLYSQLEVTRIEDAVKELRAMKNRAHAEAAIARSQAQ